MIVQVAPRTDKSGKWMAANLVSIWLLLQQQRWN
jgi:hypothetical protein